MSDMPMIKDLEILERSNSMYILRLLEKYPGMNKTEIMSTEGRNLSTKCRRIDELLKAGLLDVDANSKKELIFSLSSYGERIAVHLDAIYEIIKEHDAHMNAEGTVYADEEAIERFRLYHSGKDE